MNNLIITKWIEPYRLLETVKEYCEMTDYTFDGSNKFVQKNKMYDDLGSNQAKFALYMKNVNKFYVFNPDGEFDLEQKLIEVFDFKKEDYFYSQDSEEAISMVDMGKSEASFLYLS